MLVVHDTQIEALERELFGAMQARVERAIAATFPEFRAAERACADSAMGEDAQIRAIVDRGIESAVEYEIGDGADFAAFIALGLALRLAAPGASAEWIFAYLKRPDASGPTKLRMIESRLRARAQDNPTFGVIAQRVAQARERAAV